MGKGGYGTVEFWDEYYVQDRPEPYDWFFSCEYLGAVLTDLVLPQDRVLMVGCGNAPFSAELAERGYTNMVNIDNCELVIEQQRARFPELDWEVQDVRSMTYNDGYFDVIVDKGLLDNLRCYQNPEENTMAALRDMHRVLKPGGLYMCFSFHGREELLEIMHREQDMGWACTHAWIRNPRWPEIKVGAFSFLVAFKDHAPTHLQLQLDLLLSSAVSPQDGEKLFLTGAECAEMKAQAEELKQSARRQAQLEQQQRQAADAQATQGPPNGTLEEQLRLRRGSLRKVPEPVVKAPLLTADSEAEQEQKGRPTEGGAASS